MGLSPAEQINQIVRKVVKGGIPACPMEESLHLAQTSPESIKELAVAVMKHFPEGGTYLDATMGFLPEEDWPSLVESALDAFSIANDDTEASESILAYASLQSPSSLHPHLDRVFELGPNKDSYYAEYPWRESGNTHFDYLRGIVEGESVEEDDRIRAWRALFQTRHLPAVEWAVANASRIAFPQEQWTQESWIQAHLHMVGLQQQNNSIGRLCADTLFHIEFPDDHFDPESRPLWRARLHPTWQLKSTVEASFGGSTEKDCSLCRSKLHRLLELEAVPEGLGISGLPRLTLATCLSCLGYEHAPLFYRHGADGIPASVGYKGPKVKPQFPVGSLKECRVRLAATPKRWFWQDWALSNGRENLNRIGGEPSWVQDAEYPQCPSCNGVMHYLMQLDSDLPTDDGGEWLWGSGGIGYGFWCNGCKVSAFHWQCT